MSAATDTRTLATPANMRRFRELHPGRDLPGGGHVEGRRCFAFSPLTGEQFSGSAGDYWQLGDDEPLRDRDGEPMILAVSETRFADALTGEAL
jgi:hypothetical protein